MKPDGTRKRKARLTQGHAIKYTQVDDKMFLSLFFERICFIRPLKKTAPHLRHQVSHRQTEKVFVGSPSEPLEYDRLVRRKERPLLEGGCTVVEEKRRESGQRKRGGPPQKFPSRGEWSIHGNIRMVVPQG
jgi:hypothetical protein